jgi:hypothetical protein
MVAELAIEGKYNIAIEGKYGIKYTKDGNKYTKD